VNNEHYIKRCLELAKKGLGTTAPNPMVGAVLVYQNRIIGEGYTSPYGGNHAEVNCINSVKEKDKKHISKSTLFVSLEPCSHFGKTPPCSNLIVKNGIKNVVIGAIDSNVLVSGKGVKYLIDNGCHVVTNVLKEECVALNKRFFTFQNKKRPFIILKWAESKDGFIGLLKKDVAKPIWISNAYSQQLVHKWRSEEQAILVGTTTAVSDNPKLNTRSFSGKNPIRVVLDNQLRIPKDFHLFDQSVKTIVFTSKKEFENQKNIIFEQIDFENHVPKKICEVLFGYDIQSVIIEGGKRTLQSFINANLWDEARVFIGNINLSGGIKAPKIDSQMYSKKYIDNDMLMIYKNENSL